MADTTLSPTYAKPGCTDTCGTFIIPYPFGIGPNCYLNKWFHVTCINSSTPYLSALNNLPLLGVDLNQQMVLVNFPTTSTCQTPVWNSTQIINLYDTPFMFSKQHNKFIVEGCGNANISTNGVVLTGCSTICSQQSLSVKRNNCYGNNCCQTNIPFYLEDYSVEVKNSSGSCVSAFLVADNSYVDELFPGLSDDGDDSSKMVLRWMLLDNDYSEVGCGYNISRHELKKDNVTSVNTWKCKCWSDFEEGNAYLSGGCKVPEECTKCMEKSGLCGYKESYSGVTTFYCDHRFHHGGSKSSSSRAVFLGNAK
ncbi:hypothetical protein QVD17_37392 [Tagetes erecta]|uniref:Wall-associated receptor kinase galacturonan-binding domain-containing protein n=1 Tax=Tagetes erecta TaxID=13708 RepID=A0AAD8NJT6_TARER|nr:hypothetical protein QVD17_37392 [Tagetes erecta]